MKSVDELIKIRDRRRKFNHLRFAENQPLTPLQDTEILICSSTGCSSCGTDKIIEAIKNECLKHGIQDKVRITKIGCFGLCAMGPIVSFKPTDIFYTKVRVEDAESTFPSLPDATASFTSLAELL